MAWIGCGTNVRPFGDMKTGLGKHCSSVLPGDAREEALFQVIRSTGTSYVDNASSRLMTAPATPTGLRFPDYRCASSYGDYNAFLSYSDRLASPLVDSKFCSPGVPVATEPLPKLPFRKNMNLPAKIPMEQQRTTASFLLEYMHATLCFLERGECNVPTCDEMKSLIIHMHLCKDVNCCPKCLKFRQAIEHYERCKNDDCSICDSARNMSPLDSKNLGQQYAKTQAGQAPSPGIDSNSYRGPYVAPECYSLLSIPNKSSPGDVCLQTCNSLVHCDIKFSPTEGNPGHIAGVETVNGPSVLSTQSISQAEQNYTVFQNFEVNNLLADQKEDTLLYNEVTAKDTLQEMQNLTDVTRGETVLGTSLVDDQPDEVLQTVENSDVVKSTKVDDHCVDTNNEIRDDSYQHCVETNNVAKDNFASDCKVELLAETEKDVDNMKPENPSILHTFSAETIQNYIIILNEQLHTTKDVARKFNGTDIVDQNGCSLCGIDKLFYEPEPRHCALCGKRISSTGTYYERTKEPKQFLCSTCFRENPKIISRENPKFTSHMPKHEFQRSENYASTAATEPYVQCEKCKAWQHMNCALFNGEINNEYTKYTCPRCFLEELRSGESSPLEPCSVLQAQDLPKCQLSDRMELWINNHLEEDRAQRASNLGKTIDEVPGVEGLTIRVVSSVKKSLKVLPRFREFLKHTNYPEEFPYRSRAIALFQKIGGIDVCIFVMYVQEYGSESPLPNQRHVYLSYIDSVKYFQPEIKAANGEALRTFVYQQMLIGYMAYCKEQGFVSFSLWACPSTKHDDYILNCHPETQKMPRADKLRGWYQTLINKAIKENVVVERTTISDCFLQPSKDCKSSISAAHLPYCENDFWIWEVERILENNKGILQKSEKDMQRLLRIFKRDEQNGNPDEILLLHRLQEKMVRGTKEDCIMLYLHENCKRCRKHLLSGGKWNCTSCKNFQLCDQCYNEEEKHPYHEKHPLAAKKKHIFTRIEKNSLPDTDDGDRNMESKYFDSRIDFLKLCKENLYQFGTLRRAQYSTMMILFHLHSSICFSCHCGLGEGETWHCLRCQGYYFCDSCHQKEGDGLHKHPLIKTVSKPSCDNNLSKQSENEVNPSKEVPKDVLAVLVHSSRCSSCSCNTRYCLQMKTLFAHATGCAIRFRGGCLKCQIVWNLIRRHSLQCTESSDCRVPRCNDMRLHRIKKQKTECASDHPSVQKPVPVADCTKKRKIECIDSCHDGHRSKNQKTECAGDHPGVQKPAPVADCAKKQKIECIDNCPNGHRSKNQKTECAGDHPGVQKPAPVADCTKKRKLECIDSCHDGHRPRRPKQEVASGVPIL